MVACLLCAAVDSSHAFYDRGSQVIAVDVGFGIPSAKVSLPATMTPEGKSLIGNLGAIYGAQYLYYLKPHCGVGLNLNYGDFGDYSPLGSIFGIGITPTLSSKSAVILAVAKYSFRVENRVIPYIQAGVGVHYSSRKLSGSPRFGVWSDTGTNEKRVLGDSSGSSYALEAGAGLDVTMGVKYFMGAGVSYQYLGSVDYSTNALGQSLGVADLKGPALLIDVFLKLGYKF